MFEIHITIGPVLQGPLMIRNQQSLQMMAKKDSRVLRSFVWKRGIDITVGIRGTILQLLQKEGTHNTTQVSNRKYCVHGSSKQHFSALYNVQYDVCLHA